MNKFHINLPQNLPIIFILKDESVFYNRQNSEAKASKSNTRFGLNNILPKTNNSHNNYHRENENENEEKPNGYRRLISLNGYLSNHHQHRRTKTNKSNGSTSNESNESDGGGGSGYTCLNSPSSATTPKNDMITPCPVANNSNNTSETTTRNYPVDHFESSDPRVGNLSSASSSSCSSPSSSYWTTPLSSTSKLPIVKQPVSVSQQQQQEKFTDMSLSSSNSASNLAAASASPLKSSIVVNGSSSTTTTTNGDNNTLKTPSQTQSTNSLSYLDDVNLKLAVIDFNDLNKIIKLHSCIDLQEWIAFKSKTA